MDRVEVTIFIVGLIASVVAGVVAYEKFGLYGDGPFDYGIYRMTDPDTGQSVMYRDVKTPDGKTVRQIFNTSGEAPKAVQLNADGGRETLHLQSGKVTQVDIDKNGDGKPDIAEYLDASNKIVKAGFSVANDGVIDAWAYKDPKGQLQKIEVSTRRDGKIDRWEYYEKGQLARVEEDTNHDGRVDQWSLYDSGILLKTVKDFDNDGKPDEPLTP